MSANQPIILDGGMGQELYRRGIKKDNGLWSANALMSDPDTVRDVHVEFIQAGARVITTNTYSSNPFRLKRENIGDQFDALNDRACALAQEAREKAGIEGVRIAGCLPPLYASFRPDIRHPFEDMLSEYRRIVEKLAPHVDLFLAETMTSPKEALAAATAIQESGMQSWIAWTLANDGSGLMRGGETLHEAYDAVKALKPDAVLVNCCPPESATAGLKVLKAITQGELIGAYANGFTPIPAKWEKDIEKLGVRKDLDPQSYLEHVKSWISDGADIVGGCCEIGPRHIQVIAEHVSGFQPLKS